MATASKKRKRITHSLETKLEIVKALEKGDSQRLVVQKFEIAKSTIADIWRDREKIIDSVASSHLHLLTKSVALFATLSSI